MVGHRPLEASILVRVQVRQQCEQGNAMCAGESPSPAAKYAIFVMNRRSFRSLTHSQDIAFWRRVSRVSSPEYRQPNTQL
jgi:hypothetical protein